jgi:uncharacterized protein
VGRLEPVTETLTPACPSDALDPHASPPRTQTDGGPVEFDVMQCPHDQTVLQMTERQGIEIDYCPSCRGVWLDRGELDKIIERASAPDPPEAPRSEQRHDPRTEVAGYPPGYTQAPAYPQYPAYGRSPKSPDSPDDYYGRGYDSRYQGKKKRKSFIGDLFDF